MQKDYNSQEEIEDSDDENPSEVNSLDYDEEAVDEDGKKFHRCTYPNCGKVFRFKSEISRHIVIHFPKRPYKCKYKGCKKAFKRIDALENHSKAHAKKRFFVCDIPDCEQKFTTKPGLRYHLLRHNKERNYKCTFPNCDRSFLTASQLKQHERASVYHSKILHKDKPEEEKVNTDNFQNESRHYVLSSEDLNLQKYMSVEKNQDFSNQNTEDLQSSYLTQHKYEIGAEHLNLQHGLILDDPNELFDQNDSLFIEFLKGKNENNSEEGL